MRKTVRTYKEKPVSQGIIKKIIESGNWASSVHGFQPWNFIVIESKETINKISDIMITTAKKIGTGPNILLSSSARSLGKSPLVIAVYSNNCFYDFSKKFTKKAMKIARFAELCAVSAGIQNMILYAESVGLGSCWYSTPLFCEKELNKIFAVKGLKLIALLAFGYSAKKMKRAKRNTKKIKHIK